MSSIFTAFACSYEFDTSLRTENKTFSHPNSPAATKLRFLLIQAELLRLAARTSSDLGHLAGKLTRRHFFPAFDTRHTLSRPSTRGWKVSSALLVYFARTLPNLLPLQFTSLHVYSPRLSKTSLNSVTLTVVCWLRAKWKTFFSGLILCWVIWKLRLLSIDARERCRESTEIFVGNSSHLHETHKIELLSQGLSLKSLKHCFCLSPAHDCLRLLASIVNHSIESYHSRCNVVTRSIHSSRLCREQGTCFTCEESETTKEPRRRKLLTSPRRRRVISLFS